MQTPLYDESGINELTPFFFFVSDAADALARVFPSGKPSLPSLIFASRAAAYPQYFQLLYKLLTIVTGSLDHSIHVEPV
jgi:hypothetical protein